MSTALSLYCCVPMLTLAAYLYGYSQAYRATQWTRDKAFDEHTKKFADAYKAANRDYLRGYADGIEFMETLKQPQ